MTTSQTLLSIMRRHWGYDSFRPLQEDIMLSVMQGRDTLALMPTGGGKSLTFQVPGLALGGLTVVVTPLVSLMKDQVDNLRRHHIRAVYLRAGMTARETRMAWEALVNGKASFLYVSPERLENARFMTELRQLDVRLIVVDEAHCISQWGYDFRPSYLKIERLRKIHPGVPVLAVTATATPRVAADICDNLRFPSHNIMRRSFVRDNISYLVRPTADKIAEMLHILERTSGSAIVYVRSRKRTVEVAEMLSAHGHSALAYHAGLQPEIKELRQNAWKDGNVRVMVATNAFGMGIDKPDVRVVIHYQMPPSLEEYYQEAGRAGRDGLPSFAVLLAGDRDAATARRHVTESFPDKDTVIKIYERIFNFLNISLDEGEGRVYAFDIERFCDTFGYREVTVEAALKILEGSRYLVYSEDPNPSGRAMICVDRDDLYKVSLTDEEERLLVAMMRTYTGLFSDYVLISEYQLASKTGLTSQQVYDTLLLLRRNKVVKYIPARYVPMIVPTTHRIEPRYIVIARSAYEERKAVMQERTEAMIAYMQMGSGCRVQHMLSWFGETDSPPCGKCDVCRRHATQKQQEPTDAEIADAVMQQISSKGAILIGSLDVKGARYERVTRVVGILLEEGRICVQHGYFRLP